MARKNAVVNVTEDAVNGTQTFEAIGHADSITLDIKAIVDRENPGTWELLNVNTRAALLHGTEQKVRDAAALEKTNGKSAPPSAKFAEMKRIVDHLNSGGSWTTRTAGAVKIAEAKVAELTAELQAMKDKMRAAGLSV